MPCLKATPIFWPKKKSDLREFDARQRHLLSLPVVARGRRGETEGRKGRETVIVSRFTFEAKDHIALLPITASLPARDQTVYELPETEVRRLSRGGKARLWVVLSEINFDVVGESFYLEPDCKIGEISPRVFAEIWKAFVDALNSVSRSPPAAAGQVFAFEQREAIHEISLQRHSRNQVL